MVDLTRDVTVVIPVLNEIDTIAAAVRSVQAQDYEGRIEIAAADGGSTDGTKEVLDSLAAEDPAVIVIDNPARSVASGLNVAIAASTGEMIVRCDGHSVLPPEYVSTVVAALQETGAANVGGVQHPLGMAVVERAIAAAMSSRLGSGGVAYRSGRTPGPTDTVYLGAFRRETLEALRGFNESLSCNEDYELNYRIRAAGGVVRLDPTLRVEYRPRSSFKLLWRQYYRYGRCKRRMLRLHPEALRLRQLGPPGFVLGLLASLILAFGPFPMLSVILPAGYLAIATVFALLGVIRRRDFAALLMPVALATMHTSWGIGFMTTGRSTS
jgi:glycosyltransferase involved in cell wall biosynthesis